MIFFIGLQSLGDRGLGSNPSKAIKGNKMVNNVEKMTPEQIISELRRWHMCYRDAPDNFDARLIKRSIQTIENLLDKLEENGIIIEEVKDETSMG